MWCMTVILGDFIIIIVQKDVNRLSYWWNENIERTENGEKGGENGTRNEKKHAAFWSYLHRLETLCGESFCVSDFVPSDGSSVGRSIGYFFDPQHLLPVGQQQSMTSVSKRRDRGRSESQWLHQVDWETDVQRKDYLDAKENLMTMMSMFRFSTLHEITFSSLHHLNNMKHRFWQLFFAPRIRVTSLLFNYCNIFVLCFLILPILFKLLLGESAFHFHPMAPFFFLLSTCESNQNLVYR